MRSFHYSFIFCFLFFVVLCADEVKPDATIMIPMRDGVELQTDLYLPSPDARNLPCILLRNPAGRNAFGKEIIELAKAGYVIALQDTRNVLDEQGMSFPFVSDGCGKLQDGYDTVEWLAKSPYTNGRIGTWGPSALGITQLLMAPSNPPHLQCQYILMAAPSLYHHAAFLGGQFLKNQVEEWLKRYAKHPDVLQNICNRYSYDNFWKNLNSLEGTSEVNAPAIFVAGWYDTFLEGTLSAFRARQTEGGKGAKNQQKLVIGPWTHTWPKSTQLGDFEMPSGGVRAPIDISPKAWFDHNLKNTPTAIASMAPVTYYVMGPFDGSPSKGNVWKTSPLWPVAFVNTSLYLASDSKLQKVNGQSDRRKIEYSPLDPIPTIGGHNLFLEAGPKDQRPIEGRSDVLLFTTEKLTEDLEVTGVISAILYVQSNCEEYDICLRVCDVYPDGRSLLISEGMHRVHHNAQQLSGISKVEVAVSPTSIVFAKGHSIRLSVSNSNYPRYEKSAQTVVDQKCNFTVYMGKDHPSQLVLPVISSEK